MGKPRMIILIRHAQSEGNKNREIHQSIPDHRINLTPEGQNQALEAGRRLRSLLRPDDTLQFFTSPYRRTRETTEGILASLTSDHPSPSPFPRHAIKVYEEPRLREQDFGNFQPCSAAMEQMWQERADYGHFFYRIPNGESAADAYDRVSGFNESLWRQFGEEDFPSVCILVTHGLMTRIFLMKWYHFSVEYFEDLRNVNHCEFVVMKKNPDNGKYVLQNKLRTWSELKRERERERERGEERERAKAETGAAIDATPMIGSPIPMRRRWGGCPDGCDHALVKAWKKRPVRDEYDNDSGHPKHADNHCRHTHLKHSRNNSNTQHQRFDVSAFSKPLKDFNEASKAYSSSPKAPYSTTESQSPTDYKIYPETLPSTALSSSDSLDFSASSPDGTPSHISLNTRLISADNSDEDSESLNPVSKISSVSYSENTVPQFSSRPLSSKSSTNTTRTIPPLGNSQLSRGLAILNLGGRDGGGSLSGVASRISSEDEGIHDDKDEHEHNKRSTSRKNRPHLIRRSREQENQNSGQGIANALSDTDSGDNNNVMDHDALSEAKNNNDELEDEEDEFFHAAKNEDRSLRGSVY